MDAALVIYNKKGNTLDVWFDKPSREFISEETDSEIILKKDKKGRIIGIEKLNFIHTKKESRKLPLEVIVE
jgi:uncharacterized protein YuzE